MSTGFECVIPILRVSNLHATVEYYRSVLGFEKDWGDDTDSPGMAQVSRDRRPLMFCEGDQGQPGTWVWIGVEDIEPLYREYVARGAKFILPPTNYWWAFEFRVEDPDGHVLRFGSEPREELPKV